MNTLKKLAETDKKKNIQEWMDLQSINSLEVLTTDKYTCISDLDDIWFYRYFCPWIHFWCFYANLINGLRYDFSYTEMIPWNHRFLITYNMDKKNYINMNYLVFKMQFLFSSFMNDLYIFIYLNLKMKKVICEN